MYKNTEYDISYRNLEKYQHIVHYHSKDTD